MICDFNRIDALCAGELSDEERASVLAHMENCPVCRAYYEAMAGLEGNETAPEGFTRKVMDVVRATPQVKVRRTGRRVWQGMAAMAACAALVVGLGLGSGLMRTESAPESANEAMEMTRDYTQGTREPLLVDDADNSIPGHDNASALESYEASDLPLTVQTLTDPALCAQVRTWLSDRGIAALYGEGQREAYDLTADVAKALHQDFPELDLPHQMLQLELKSAE